MKAMKCYCEVCEENVKHDRQRNFTGFWRGYLAVVTLGVNELFNRVEYTCRKCGTTSEYDA